MNSYPKLFYILKEINLFDKTGLIDELNSILKQKGITKPEIIDYFKKPYLKWFISPTDDQEKQHYVTKYHPSSDDPTWAKNTFDFNTFSNEHKEELAHTIDFFNQLNERDLKKIHKIPFPIVRELVKKWDEELAKRMDSSIHHFKIGKDVEILKQWPDGYKIVKILSDEARKEEGNLMGHCVGGDYYANETILSLRDEHGMPHVTMELDKDNNIKQIKGKQNAAPLPKYAKYVRQFIDEYRLKVQADGENIGLVVWDDQYYDPDGNNWKNVYKTEIIPAQEKALEEIKKSVNPNGVIYKYIYLRQLYLKHLPPWMKDVSVRGAFNIGQNRLQSLENFPKEVNGYIELDNNPDLTSLEGLPKSCKGLTLSENSIKNLKGCPDSISEYLALTGLFKLTSLEGFPTKTGPHIHVKISRCPELKNLRGCPNSINGNFQVQLTGIESLEGGPKNVSGNYFVFINKLKDLRGCAEVIGENFDCELNYITADTLLQYLPISVGKSFIYSQQLVPGTEMNSKKVYIKVDGDLLKQKIHIGGKAV